MDVLHEGHLGGTRMKALSRLGLELIVTWKDVSRNATNVNSPDIP